MSTSFKIEYLKQSIFFLLLGNLLLGTSYIAMLPIWEGFDETAHFSYIQQIADEGKLPLNGKDPISKDIEQYYDYAPVPQALSAEFISKDRLTYQSFFSKPAKFLSRSKEFIHFTDSPRKYGPGRGYSWETQHPPLYYVLLSPIYLMTNSLSWGGQMFILRIVSYVLAWLGLVITVFTCLDVSKNQSSQNKIHLWNWAAIGAGLWPILFPAWFSDMARLGNDSICCLLLALIWFVSMRMILRGVSLKYYLLLGLFLSLGCLTKAFFVPLTVGVMGFWLFREWKLRGRDGFVKTIKISSFVVFAILASSGWWYLNNYLQYGVTLGSIDLKFLKQAGGLWNGLESNFSFYQWARSHVAMLVTFGWVGTWSLVRPPWIFLFPIVLTIILVVSAYFQAIRHSKIISAEWLPIWLILPILIGLSYHVLVRIALTGEGRGTPGYYLHILAGPMSTALGLSLYEIWARHLFRAMIQVLFSYVILFSIGITWAQALFFSGAVHASENERIYSFPEQLPPFLGLTQAYERLKVLVYPDAGLFLLIAAWGFLLIGLAFVRRYADQSI